MENEESVELLIKGLNESDASYSNLVKILLAEEEEYYESLFKEPEHDRNFTDKMLANLSEEEEYLEILFLLNN